MHCIRAAFPAIKPGKRRKVAVVIGGGVKGRFGPKLGWFVGYLEPNEEGMRRAVDLVFKVIEPWDREAQPKYRLGDYIMQQGIETFVHKAGIKLEGMPPLAKTGDEVPYAVLSKEEREAYLNLVRELKGRA
jgi:sulfite reductase alpha subunit